MNTISSVYPIMLRLRPPIIYPARASSSLKMAKEEICEEGVSLSTNKQNDSGKREVSLQLREITVKPSIMCLDPRDFGDVQNLLSDITFP